MARTSGPLARQAPAVHRPPAPVGSRTFRRRGRNRGRQERWLVIPLHAMLHARCKGRVAHPTGALASASCAVWNAKECCSLSPLHHTRRTMHSSVDQRQRQSHSLVPCRRTRRRGRTPTHPRVIRQPLQQRIAELLDRLLLRVRPRVDPDDRAQVWLRRQRARRHEELEVPEAVFGEACLHTVGGLSGSSRVVGQQLRLAVDETVILLHPVLPFAGISIRMERRCQKNDCLVRG